LHVLLARLHSGTNRPSRQGYRLFVSLLLTWTSLPLLLLLLPLLLLLLPLL
jgi:hypothetical protein